MEEILKKMLKILVSYKSCLKIKNYQKIGETLNLYKPQHRFKLIKLLVEIFYQSSNFSIFFLYKHFFITSDRRKVSLKATIKKISLCLSLHNEIIRSDFPNSNIARLIDFDSPIQDTCIDTQMFRADPNRISQFFDFLVTNERTRAGTNDIHL